MLETLAGFSSKFPKLDFKWKGEKRLRLLYPKCDPQRYAGMVIVLSIASAIAVFGICGFLELEPIWRYAIPILSIPACAVFLLYLPDMEMRQRIATIESSMPFFLRSMGMMLDIGIPFQRAMELSCDNEGALQEEMRHVLREVENGAGFQRALIAFAIEFDSKTIKRTVSQILSAYEVGGSGNEIRKIGDELLALEQHKLKEYSARSSMFGLLFIMTSAVAPTFFLVYAIAGRFVMAQKLEPVQITIGLLVVFPFVSVLLLMLSKATMPRSSFEGNSGFDAKMLLPGLITVAGFVFFPEFEFAALTIAVVVSIFLVWQTFTSGRRIEDLEENLPNALFSVSGMPRNTRAERIFGMIEEGGYGPLSEEAGKSRMQMEMNVKLDSVLEDLWARNRSPMLKRACLMMKQMIDTNSLHRLNMLAEDMTKAFQTMRERSQMFAMQKYTLMFGAVLIPLIMKMTIGLLGSIGALLEGGGMDGGIMAGFGMVSGAAAAGDAAGTGGMGEMIAFALSIVPPYLVIYAMIASAAIADAEGKRSMAAGYFIGLCALSLVIFHFINL